MTENAIDKIRAEAEKIGAETEKIIVKFQETEEKFIYLTILPFCEEVFERKISKQELEKILIDYKNGVSPVRHGEMILRNNAYECTECGHRYSKRMGNSNAKCWSFCPNCGAKMDKTSDNP